MNWSLVGLAVVAGLFQTSEVAASDAPKFKDFPSKPYVGMEAPVRFDTVQARKFRTRLREASREPINFGGRYVFAKWGAGTQCETGALVDVATGKSHFLPFAACFWTGFDSAFEFRPDSRLLVVAGRVGEEGPRGAHFFEFTGREFRYIKTIEVESDVSVAGNQVTAQYLENIEPAPGDDRTARGSRVMDALSKAIMFAIHRPVLNKGWVSDTTSFGPAQANKLAAAFYVTSIRKTFDHAGNHHILMYNPDADLFSLIRLGPENETLAGFVTGREISEGLYKRKENPQYFANVLGVRPDVVRHFFSNYQGIAAPDEMFTLYQSDEARSVAVNRNLVSFAKLIGGKKTCRETFEEVLNKADLRFDDGKTSKEVGKFYFSIWFAQIENVDGKPKVMGTAAFRDEATNRYGGYLIFDPTDTACKAAKVVTTFY